MAKVVGVKFRYSPKVYYFKAGNFNYNENCGVIVETAKGIEYGNVVILPTEIKEKMTLKPVLRLATERDETLRAELEEKRESTFEIVEQKIKDNKLDMKLVDLEYSFDGGKLTVYFVSDERVDFRELVKDLASTFHVRIELKQIGARDECKMLGGLGPCGRACCCSDYMPHYSHVTIKMAKNQNLSLNPGKICGLCGRLMCCLDYENAHYAETNKKMPKLNSDVTLKNGKTGKVTELNQLKETVTVRVPGKEKDTYESIIVPLSEIASPIKPQATESEFAADTEELKNLED